MPWLTLTIPSLATCLCSLVCRSHVERLGTQQQSMAKVAILHELRIITRAMYYVGSTLIPFSQVSSSSVKPNEQMLLSCWSQYDGLGCWQTHPSAVRKWKGSSGKWTACQADSSVFLTFFLPYRWPHLWHSRVFSPWSPTPSTLPPTVLSIWALVKHSVQLITCLQCALVHNWRSLPVKRSKYV